MFRLNNYTPSLHKMTEDEARSWYIDAKAAAIALPDNRPSSLWTRVRAKRQKAPGDYCDAVDMVGPVAVPIIILFLGFALWWHRTDPLYALVCLAGASGVFARGFLRYFDHNPKVKKTQNSLENLARFYGIPASKVTREHALKMMPELEKRDSVQSHMGYARAIDAEHRRQLEVARRKQAAAAAARKAEEEAKAAKEAERRAAEAARARSSSGNRGRYAAGAAYSSPIFNDDSAEDSGPSIPWHGGFNPANGYPMMNDAVDCCGNPYGFS